MDKSSVARVCDVVIEIGILIFLFLQPIPKDTATIKAFALYLPLLAWVVKMILEKRFALEKSPVHAPLLIVVIVSLLSLFLSPLWSENIRELKGSLVKFVVLFFLVTNNIRRPEQVQRMVFSLAALYGLTLLAGYYNFLIAGKFGMNRGLWAFNNANNQLGTLLNVTFPFAVVTLLWFAGRFTSLWLTVLILVHTFSFALTFSRGAWFGFAGAGVVLAVLEKRAVIAGAVLGSLLLAALALSGTGRFTKTSMEESLAVRWKEIWVPALHMVEDRPLLGHGYGWRTAQRLYGEYRLPENLPSYLNEHNTLLAVAVQTGLIGLLSYLFMLWVIGREIYLAWRHSTGMFRHISGAILFGFVAEYLIHGLDEVNNMDWMGLLFWAITAMAVVIRRIAVQCDAVSLYGYSGTGVRHATAGFIASAKAQG